MAHSTASASPAARSWRGASHNVLQPAIQGKATDVSPFFVILGVTIFGALLGVLGALVAIPLVASIQIVVREVTADRRTRVAAARAEAAPPV